MLYCYIEKYAACLTDITDISYGTGHLTINWHELFDDFKLIKGGQHEISSHQQRLSTCGRAYSK